jgi:hypothetical protein
MDRKLLLGIGIGLAAGILGRALYPALKEAGRPLAKATLRSGLAAVEKARESLAEMGETVEDLMAEVKAEMAEEATRRGAAAMPNVSSRDFSSQQVS